MHFHFICPKFLRQTFHEFAGCSIQRSEWARAYYHHLRNDKNRSHQVAVRSLAFKWLALGRIFLLRAAGDQEEKQPWRVRWPTGEELTQNVGSG